MTSERKPPRGDGHSALASARRVLAIESAALEAVKHALDDRIDRAVEWLAAWLKKKGLTLPV